MRQPSGRAAVFSISGKERTAFSFWSAKRICAPILFFLAEKEKNRFKKAFLWVRRNAEEAGGQSRPPLRVRWKVGGCNDVLLLLSDLHPSATQTPSPEGSAIRCGGGWVQSWNRMDGISERREQSAETFRVVGMDATDS